MENKRLHAATVVASPTASSWSQSYTAGNLFAVVSISYSSEPKVNEDLSLGTIGKEILNTLEAEYFTIENKTLSAIKTATEIAIKQALEKENISLSLALCSVLDNVLYVIAVGDSKIYLKRANKLGLLLTSQKAIVASASGFLEDNDIIILQTEQFGKIISKTQLASAIDHNSLSEIAENLSPILHEKEEGGASAIVITYKETLTETTEEQTIMEEKQEINVKKKIMTLSIQTWTWIRNLISNRFYYLNFSFSRKQKTFLVITTALILLLLGSSIFVLRQKEAAKNDALFEEVFSKAQKKYDEGQSLFSLNKNLSRDDFLEAKKLVNEGKNKFKKGSKYEKKLSELSAKIDSALQSASGISIVEAKPADAKDSLLLTAAKENNALYSTQDEKNIFVLTESAIFSIDKKTKNKKTLIPNKDHWTNASGLGAYNGNIYVLDKNRGQILKFVPSEDEYIKTNYLAGKTQDFSKVTSLAIDASIFVLFENGEVKKFTRGKQEDFKVSELDKPLSKPQRIFTDTEIDSLYILDNGNSRIVVLNKTGVYQTQYQANIFKDAQEFEVLEKDKKIFVLSSDKIWEIDF
ncbi:MAG: hypothetical protein HYV37_00405 [Candidatus Levyibacteriota bacterium]|nr:MAG: hypothetical protein HYV37_00405 [Candidatus Levybacteria bacterium]